MNKMKTIDNIISIAESLDWKVEKEASNNGKHELCFQKYSPAGQDFSFNVSGTDGDDIVNETMSYIDTYDPYEEAQLWIRDGHGQNGAPDDPEDVVADMEECKTMMQKLVEAWNGVEKKTAVIYRTIRIDYEYDPTRQSAEEAAEYATSKVVSDAIAHTHTIENGLRITDITDCGESI